VYQLLSEYEGDLMTTEIKTRYLKGNISFEPLICRWYAWPFLFSPATFSMVVKNRLIPLLESFVEDPDFHRESVKNPALRGGLFLDFSGNLSLAKTLLAELRASVEQQLEFADALILANDLLIRDGNGTSLEPMYDRMPPILRGLVELGYDLNNHASIRLIEPLLYTSNLYNPTFQSVFLRQIDEENRPFVLATPLIDPSTGVLINAPFSAPIFDDLARMRERGLTEPEFIQLCARIKDYGGDVSRLSNLCTEEAPASRYSPCPSNMVRIRYFGHASLLIETNSVSVMTDPSFGYETDRGIDRFNFRDLPESLDYVVITHSHQDHVLFEALLQLRYKIKTIVVPKCNGGFLQDPSLKWILEKAGFKSVIEMDELDSINIPGGSITGLPFLGEHCDLHIKSKLGIYVETGGHRVMCLADSNNLDSMLYTRLSEVIEPPDLVFIGMECAGGPMSWLYGDLLPRRLRREHDQSRRLSGSNFERAKRIVDLFRPRGVMVYAMGAEPWFTHLTSIVYTDNSIPIVESNKLVEYCGQKNIVAERLYGKREIILSGHQLVLS
jgi:L-ascorbate metabolism protein UlaG (beta-lactamase superfamily)